MAGGGAGVTGDAERIDVAVVDDHPIIRDGMTGWVAVPDSGIRVVATATTVDAVLAGPGRGAHVILLDLDLGDGTTVARNVAAISAAGPRSWCCPPRTGLPRSGTRSARERVATSLKQEEAAELRAAIRAVAAGEDWVSPRLACIFATDDAPGPADAERAGDADTSAVCDRPAHQVSGPTAGHRGGNRQAVCPARKREVRTGKPCGAYQSGPVPSSRRGRASPFTALARNPPSEQGQQEIPVLGHSIPRNPRVSPCPGVTTPLRGSRRRGRRGFGASQRWGCRNWSSSPSAGPSPARRGRGRARRSRISRAELRVGHPAGPRRAGIEVPRGGAWPPLAPAPGGHDRAPERSGKAVGARRGGRRGHPGHRHPGGDRVRARPAQPRSTQPIAWHTGLMRHAGLPGSDVPGEPARGDPGGRQPASVRAGRGGGVQRRDPRRTARPQAARRGAPAACCCDPAGIERGTLARWCSSRRTIRTGWSRYRPATG